MSERTPFCERCLFRNHCLCIRLLGLPCGQIVSGWFAGRAGLLMVSHGSLEVESAGKHRGLHEGDVWQLQAADSTRLWANEETDVVFFERVEPIQARLALNAHF